MVSFAVGGMATAWTIVKRERRNVAPASSMLAACIASGALCCRATCLWRSRLVQVRLRLRLKCRSPEI
jgi:hypothetical protein